MARVTVEDCLEKVNDRFELVAVAALRAKNIAAGEPLTIDRNGEKNSVLALREIALGSVNVEELRDSVVKSLQREREIDEIMGVNAPSPERLRQEAEELMKLESEAEEMSEEQAERQAASLDDEDLDEDEEDNELKEPEGDFSFEDEADVED